MISVTADKLPNMHSTEFNGIPVVIQWPKGSIRVGKHEDGTPFKTEMRADYGYIPDTVASGDEERLDVYIGPNKDAEYAYAVEQLRKDDENFDEFKLMLGFDSLEEAEEAYEYHLGEDPDVMLGDISEVPFDYLFDRIMEERHEDEEQEIEETETEIERDEEKVAAIEPDKIDTDPDVEFNRQLEYLNSLGWLGRNPWYPEKYPWFCVRLYGYGWVINNDLAREKIAEGSTLEELKEFLSKYDIPVLRTKPRGKTIEALPVQKKLNAAEDDKLSIIDAFVKLYKHEFDFYDEVASKAKDALEDALQDAGIRAIVTFRAKRPRKLRKKLMKRNRTRNYQSFRNIYDDIVDLAGVRVALYLPANRDAVGEIIEKLFAPVREPKRFPESSHPEDGDTLGYVATHYLIQLRPETLHKDELRYADTNIEIQVASVLMHAWAEVTHDLIYKPEKGSLTHEEMRMIKDLNDLVQAGEAMLEKLQGSVEGRQKEDLRFDIEASLSKLAGMLADRSSGSGARIAPEQVAKVARQAANPGRPEKEKSIHGTYLKARLAAWKAHRADGLDDRLRETFEKAQYRRPAPSGDDKFLHEALARLYPDARDVGAIGKDEYRQVLALAQRLKEGKQ
jgi:ppGpp synthetase/RelA/SpoT-type nucleotidyltranferase